MYLLISDKVISAATYDDAVEVAKYECDYPPGTDEYIDFIAEKMK